MASSSQAPDWLRLQRKIFSRWVNQKLSLTRGIHCNDVVTELGDGFLLMNLVEVLSEKQCNEKLTKNAKLRVHKLDNLNHVLNFVWNSGIQMKIKPSSENLVDGDEKACLGLIWAIMLKFLRFGDDDEDGQESLNAKDSLLMWVQNQVSNYSLEVKNFGKNFHDGKILCAIIHKHRPKLINWETVSASSGPSNLQLAMDAATQYFGLEQYLSTDDILKLDENSMVVYVSEYYHGIAEQRKMDLAARRIQKVITFTIENDALRAEFNSTSAQLVQNLTRVESVLNDRTIDNTLAGAKRKLEEFYDFKKNDKSVILADQLNLESLYNNLAMRLSHHKRPEFIPAPGCSLKDLEARVKQLEQVEHERKVALHAELNRQLRLVNINEQHETRYNKLVAWLGEKKAYTAFEENIDSVGTAQFQLKVLDAFFQENQQVRDTIVSYLTKQGAELLAEKYEHSDRVQAREQEIAEGLSVISSQAANKKQVLDAALALEIRKEELRQQFADLAANFSRWAQASADNLERFFGYTLEEVESFDAKLSALDAELSAAAVAKHDEAVAVFEEGRGIGVRENRYSSLSPADLAASRDSLLRAIADRRGEYDRELQRQQRNDALSKQFSQLADPFSQSISEFKDSITNSKAPLEEQLAQVQSRLASQSSQELDAIKDLQAQLDAAGVTNNKYTLLTAKDCEAQWEQYSVFLQRKAAMLEKEIEHVRLRGVTPEQYREIEENFRSFDKDSDGAISRRELKALLYSLGEEKNRSEVNAITTEFGNNDGAGRVEYEGFKEFMIRLLGDTDTKEEIEAGFFLINRGADFATKEKLSFVMEDSAVDYFVQTAPQIPEGYNYKAWTADVFSR